MAQTGIQAAGQGIMFITPMDGTSSADEPVSCVLLEPGEVRSWWSQIEGLVNEALATECSGENADDLLRLAEGGDVQVWLAVTSPIHILAIGITHFQPYLHYTALELYQAAGRELHRWKPILLLMEKFALDHGCDWLFVDGRRGFVKLFAEYGYDEQYTRVGKRLKNGE